MKAITKKGVDLIDIRLYSKEGRLIKNIPRPDLPIPQPDFISYAGNIYHRILGVRDYTESSIYVYEEKPVTPPKTEPAEVLKTLAAAADLTHL